MPSPYATWKSDSLSPDPQCAMDFYLEDYDSDFWDEDEVAIQSVITEEIDEETIVTTNYWEVDCRICVKPIANFTEQFTRKCFFYEVIPDADVTEEMKCIRDSQGRVLRPFVPDTLSVSYGNYGYNVAWVGPTPTTPTGADFEAQHNSVNSDPEYVKNALAYLEFIEQWPSVLVMADIANNLEIINEPFGSYDVSCPGYDCLGPGVFEPLAKHTIEEVDAWLNKISEVTENGEKILVPTGYSHAGVLGQGNGGLTLRTTSTPTRILGSDKRDHFVVECKRTLDAHANWVRGGDCVTYISLSSTWDIGNYDYMDTPYNNLGVLGTGFTLQDWGHTGGCYTETTIGGLTQSIKNETCPDCRHRSQSSKKITQSITHPRLGSSISFCMVSTSVRVGGYTNIRTPQVYAPGVSYGTEGILNDIPPMVSGTGNAIRWDIEYRYTGNSSSQASLYNPRKLNAGDWNKDIRGARNSTLPGGSEHPRGSTADQFVYNGSAGKVESSTFEVDNITPNYKGTNGFWSINGLMDSTHGNIIAFEPGSSEATISYDLEPESTVEAYLVEYEQDPASHWLWPATGTEIKLWEIIPKVGTKSATYTVGGRRHYLKSVKSRRLY